ncbi:MULTISPECIES: glycosyltransferase family 2 protein [Carboxydocella]|uniref:Glucosyl-3-phosphoglycerate synthase n=2 Tax=Carboxydocella TaxID=178898 RepID=A0A1T4P768_9FIRM|nr:MULTISPECIES: glycosyltransferase family 2 protein [Carboxydocella]AVX20727.1 Glycosyltransferase involved in cell wall bisynthesis [Carboxydocella thermautotrophica]AVX31146.1 Glycosyltransferase involved in cell wall bisynthesis [Carboxydocella thermautotrophica]GAW30711.1 hypothetical protein JDF658_04760 [Carboxydocella sp. JDF658]SJZ87383.1 Glycosyltransferase involved in cell wall bisynthesis [Carboxydocella sporoproducens DSM 16521]
MGCSAIIPAYNEAKTIAPVVKTTRNHALVDEVIVVCDGCQDQTAILAEQAGAKVIELPYNQGKGAALLVGARAALHSVLLFLDADLIGLRDEHITNLLNPILNGQAEMTVGIFSGGRLTTDLAQKITPSLSGQRALLRDLITPYDELASTRYGVEVFINSLAREKGWKVLEVELFDLTHRMKEEKFGLVKGMQARMKMYWEIAKSLTGW